MNACLLRSACFALALLLAPQAGAETFTVTSTDNEDTVGTLRWAIDQSNTTAGLDTIKFEVGTDQTITLVNLAPAGLGLPLAITDAVTFDASASSGLTITRASANTSFSINADTSFRDMTLISEGGFSLSNDLTVNQNQRDGEISADIVNSGGLIKQGNQTLSLTGNNSYTGNTRIENGTLQVTTSSVLNSDVEIQSGAFLSFSQTGNGTYQQEITGDGKLIIDGDGIVTLDRAGATNDWKGGTEVKKGTLRISGLNLGALPTGGTKGNVHLTTANSALELHTTTAAGDTYSGVASGLGKLVKTGSADLTLSGQNTHKGGTEIREGTMIIKQTDFLPSSETVAISKNANLSIDLTAAAPGQQIFNSNITGEGAFGKTGANTELKLTGQNDFKGGIGIVSGSLRGTTGSLPGDISLAANTIVIFDQAGSGGHGGDITGQGILRKEGTGRVTLTGTNTYNNFGAAHSVNTEVLVGELAVAAQSLPVNATTGPNQFDVSVAQNTTLIFSQSANPAQLQWTGTITDGAVAPGGVGGTIAKEGSGSLTLTQNQAYTGDTLVTAGHLVLQGDLTATRSVTAREAGTLQMDSAGKLSHGTLTIDSGGSLAGSSTTGSVNIPTTVLSGGRVAPANQTLPALHVAGALDFQGGSSFVVNIDDTGTADTLLATGTTTIAASAELQAILAPGDYRLGVSTKVFDSGGTGVRNGKFALLAPTFAFLSVSLQESPPPPHDINDIFLDVAIRPNVDLADFAKTRNEAAVGNALYRSGAPYGGDQLDQVLQTMTAGQLPGALEQLAGISLTSPFTARQAESERFQRTVARRMRVYADRASSARTFKAPRTGNFSTQPAWLGSALAMQSPDAAGASQTGWGNSQGPGFGGWLNGYGTFGDVYNSINAPGFDYGVYGAATGADYSFNKPFLLGASVAYARTDIDSYDRISASAQGDTVRGSIYGAYAQPSLAAYLSLQLSYAWSDFSNKRRIQFGGFNQEATSDATGNEFSGYVELGTRAFDLGHEIRLRPFLGLGYGYYEVGSFRESGAPSGANLAIDSSHYQSLDLAFGMMLDQSYELSPRLRLRTELRLRYDHEFLDTNPKLDARISGQPYSVEGVSVGRDIGLAGLSVEFIDAGGLSTFLSFDARANTEFVEYNGNLGILVRF